MGYLVSRFFQLAGSHGWCDADLLGFWGRKGLNWTFFAESVEVQHTALSSRSSFVLVVTFLPVWTGDIRPEPASQGRRSAVLIGRLEREEFGSWVKSGIFGGVDGNAKIE